MKTRIVGLVAIVLICASTTGFADPMTVTITSGGWLGVFIEDCGGMQLGSAAFTVNAAEFCTGSPGLFRAGSSFDVTRTTTGNRDHVSGVGGTINGVTYGFGSLSLDGTQLHFVGNAITVPPAAPVFTLANFAVPFKMDGNLTVTRSTDGSFVYSTDVTGTGQFDVTLSSEGMNQWSVVSADYRFTAAPAATPEPATTALFAFGLAAVGTAKRLRRR
jgi:hypothetical protein